MGLGPRGRRRSVSSEVSRGGVRSSRFRVSPRTEYLPPGPRRDPSSRGDPSSRSVNSSRSVSRTDSSQSVNRTDVARAGDESRRPT